jgi:hypothetical protein
VVCARCVEKHRYDENITHATQGEGSSKPDATWQGLLDKVTSHYATNHSAAPSKIEPGASLVSGTTISGNTAFHAGNETQIDAGDTVSFSQSAQPSPSSGDLWAQPITQTSGYSYDATGVTSITKETEVDKPGAIPNYVTRKPSVTDDVVATCTNTSSGGVAYGIDRSTENIIWTYDFPGNVKQVNAQKAVTTQSGQELVIYNCGVNPDVEVIALNINTGNEVWRHTHHVGDGSNGLRMSVSTKNNAVYTGNRAGTVVSASLTDGSLNWKYTLDTTTTDGTQINTINIEDQVNNYVYVGSLPASPGSDPILRVLDALTGSEVFTVSKDGEEPERPDGAAISDDGTKYIYKFRNSNDNLVIRALDTSDGSTVYENTTNIKSVDQQPRSLTAKGGLVFGFACKTSDVDPSVKTPHSALFAVKQSDGTEAFQDVGEFKGTFGESNEGRNVNYTAIEEYKGSLFFSSDRDSGSTYSSLNRVAEHGFQQYSLDGITSSDITAAGSVVGYDVYYSDGNDWFII